MLGIDYTDQLRRMTADVSWEIQLPEEMKNFFQESGPMPSMQGDERRAARMRVRAKCLAIYEVSLPAFPRSPNPLGVYTTDISRHGVGFLYSEPLLPEEEVRLVLPAFWLSARIARARRLGHKCYQIGARLLARHDPGPEAFDVQRRELVDAVVV